MWGMIGNEWAVSLLRRDIREGGVRHAYLVTGPEGVGKRTLALRMAQAWSCAQPPAPGDFCGSCRACVGIVRGAFSDLHRLGPEESGSSIRVEAVRELERKLALAPFEARGRVALLDSFETATESAANALLKTLEEPPQNVLLLLTAAAEEDLLPTIVSRCEGVRLRPVAKEEILQALVEEGAGEEEAEALAAEAEGRPGWALGLWRSPKRRQARARSLEEMAEILGSGRGERLAYAEKVIDRWRSLESYEEKRAALLAHLEPWAGALHRTMLRALDARRDPSGSAPSFDPGRDSPEAWVRAVRALEGTGDALRRNAHLQMALESFLLELPYRRDS